MTMTQTSLSSRSRVESLSRRNAITPPPWLPGAMQYEVIMGSEAYGVASDISDKDIYGFCIPPKEVVFPHTAGEILGFGKQKNRFEQYQQHHVYVPSESGEGKGVEYDFSIYNVVKYFSLCMDCNPNMIDSLFVPQRCVLFLTEIGRIVRDERHIFLHKGAWHRFKGYAYSQLKKAKGKKPLPGSRRYDSIQKHGYDCKFAYHIVRLLNEAEQILLEHDLVLDQNREQLKAIRTGEWSLEQLEKYFAQKEASLEAAYTKSTLRHSPDEERIKNLLLRCLEEWYGSLDGCVEIPDVEKQVLREIDKALEKVRHRL